MASSSIVLPEDEDKSTILPDDVSTVVPEAPEEEPEAPEEEPDAPEEEPEAPEEEPEAPEEEPEAPEEEPEAPEEEPEDETGECMFGNFKTAHPGHEKVLFLHDRFKDAYLKFWLRVLWYSTTVSCIPFATCPDSEIDRLKALLWTFIFNVKHPYPNMKIKTPQIIGEYITYSCLVLMTDTTDAMIQHRPISEMNGFTNTWKITLKFN